MGGDCLTTKPHSSPLPTLARGIEANTRVCHLFYCHGRCVKYSQTADFCVITFSHSSHPSPPGYRLLLAIGDQKEDRMPQSDWQMCLNLLYTLQFIPYCAAMWPHCTFINMSREPQTFHRTPPRCYFSICVIDFRRKALTHFPFVLFHFLGKK